MYSIDSLCGDPSLLIRDQVQVNAIASQAILDRKVSGCFIVGEVTALHADVHTLTHGQRVLFYSEVPASQSIYIHQSLLIPVKNLDPNIILQSGLHGAALLIVQSWQLGFGHHVQICMNSEWADCVADEAAAAGLIVHRSSMPGNIKAKIIDDISFNIILPSPGIKHPIGYVRWDWQRAVLAKLTLAEVTKKYTAPNLKATSFLKIACVGTSNNWQKHLLTVIRETPHCTLETILPNAQENHEAIASLYQAKVCMNIESIIEGDDNVICLSREGTYQLADVLRCIERGKHIIVENLQDLSWNDWSVINKSADRYQVMAIPYLPFCKSPLIEKTRSTLSGLCEPVNLLIRSDAANEYQMILLAMYLIQDNINQISRCGNVILLQFDDGSLVTVTLQDKTSLHLEMACQSVNVVIDDWRTYTICHGATKKTQRTANRQTGDIQWFKQFFHACQQGDDQGLQSAWTQCIQFLENMS